MRRGLCAVLVALAALTAEACAGRRVSTASAEPPAPAYCIGDPAGVTWNRLEPEEREALDLWCASVGPPVLLAGTTTNSSVNRLIVVSWNVHVGGGRVAELVERVKAMAPASESGTVGIVLLLQEAFRRGDAIPATVPQGMKSPGAIRPVRAPPDDIVEVARGLGLSLAYVPSMRNGPGTDADREDRGSAILSSEPMTDVTALELPFGSQRRVAIAATLHLRSGAAPLRVVAGHLDIRGGAGEQAARIADVVAAGPSGIPVVIGMDTNAMFGARSGSVRTIGRVAPRLTQCGGGRTNAWLARIDYIFSTVAASAIESCETLRDRHGSDHVPLVLRLAL